MKLSGPSPTRVSQRGSRAFRDRKYCRPAVAALSEGRVQLSTGTLYGALKRLLGRGWIRRVEEEAPAGGPGWPRKAYTLTDRGRRMLDADVARLQVLVAAARTRAVEAPQLGMAEMAHLHCLEAGKA